MRTISSGILGIMMSQEELRDLFERLNFDILLCAHTYRSYIASDTGKIIINVGSVGLSYYIRPDHGRHIWDEDCRPGYGLYDRALGIMYMNGILDMLDRIKERA